MTTRYESLSPAAFYSEIFGVSAPSGAIGAHIWPRRPGAFIRAIPADPENDAIDPQRELVVGQWGLVPPWVKSASDAKLRSTKLVNARHETVTTSNNFRNAWLNNQRCVIPLMAFFVDDLRSGKPTPTRIARVDGKPMAAAGLWEQWVGPEGEPITSYTLLTVNANSHALMHRYQHPGTEKRMPAILNDGAWEAWLHTSPDKAREFMRAYPANWLTANPVELR